MERRVLGRGISALIPEKPTDTTTTTEEKIVLLKTEEIVPNPYQPRVDFNEEGLADLISSIKEKGVIQPILVRRNGPHFELIAGERRLRAAKSLQINEIPAIIRDVNDEESLEISLIENIQREQLNPIEEARAYQHLIDKFGLTQERISQGVGKARGTVSNILRLLKLPQEVQDEIKLGRISFAHGKVLLELDDVNHQRNLAWKVISDGLSVRELENLVVKKCPIRRAKKKDLSVDPAIVVLEEELQHVLGTRVKITRNKKRGHIQIEFYSPEDLGRIVDVIRKQV